MLTVAAGRAMLKPHQPPPPPPPERVPSVAEYRAHVLARLAEYEITVEYRPADQMPRGAAAYAEIHKHHIVIPPIDSEEHVAIAVHEAGHCLGERCRGRSHYRDPAEKSWWKCLRCETLAWTIGALLIRPLPWSRAMHKRLMSSLKYYHTHTAGHAEAKRQLERLACELTWFDLRQRTLEASMQPSRKP